MKLVPIGSNVFGTKQFIHVLLTVQIMQERVLLSDAFPKIGKTKYSVAMLGNENDVQFHI